MESLLRWGLANSNPEDLQQAQNAPRQPLDPGIIDAILGKPDAVLMKEALEIALDDSKNEDDRVVALDNFEMLIESLDNANDLTKLNMWTPLLSLLSSQSDAIVLNTLWILGTAVQNNPKAQSDFLARDPLPLLLSALKSPSPDVRSKALYALSGSLKHSEPAATRFEELDGWVALKSCLSDNSLPIRRKAAFLFNSLLLPAAPSTDSSSPHVQQLTSTVSIARSAMPKFGILDALVDSISVQDPDEDLGDKSIRALLMFAQSGGSFDDPVKARIKTLIRDKAPVAPESEAWGLTRAEWDELGQSVQS